LAVFVHFDIPSLAMRAGRLLRILIPGLSLGLMGCENLPQERASVDAISADTEVCTSLGAGEAAPVRSRRSGVEARYDLARSMKGDFWRATVWVQFKDRKADEGASAGMLARANACLKLLEPALLGPEGERLQIELKSPPPGRPANRVRTIEVSSESMRGHSTYWSASYDCGQILHETLHLLGLVDEYPENGAVVGGGFLAAASDCRFTGPTNSIMHNSSEAVGTSLGSVAEFQCRCPDTLDEAGASACKAELAKLSGASGACPVDQPRGDRVPEEKIRHWVASLDALAPPAGEARSRVDSIRKRLLELRQGELSEDGRSYRFSRWIPAERRSILYPAQFRAITHPGCENQNSTYYQCAQEAYRSSVERGGRGCRTALPKACSSPQEWLE
jgi:hypothetical protein